MKDQCRSLCAIALQNLPGKLSEFRQRGCEHVNRSRLFFISCLAMVTTAIAFSMRGDALDGLRSDFFLTNEQIGLALSPAFWGNTVGVLFGGALADYLGLKRILQLSALG